MRIIKAFFALLWYIGLLFAFVWVWLCYNGNMLQQLIVYAVLFIALFATIPRGELSELFRRTKHAEQIPEQNPAISDAIAHYQHQKAEYIELAAEIYRAYGRKPTPTLKRQVLTLNEKIFKLDEKIAKLKSKL